MKNKEGLCFRTAHSQIIRLCSVLKIVEVCNNTPPICDQRRFCSIVALCFA